MTLLLLEAMYSAGDDCDFIDLVERVNQATGDSQPPRPKKITVALETAVANGRLDAIFSLSDNCTVITRRITCSAPKHVLREQEAGDDENSLLLSRYVKAASNKYRLAPNICNFLGLLKGSLQECGSRKRGTKQNGTRTKVKNRRKPVARQGTRKQRTKPEAKRKRKKDNGCEACGKVRKCACDLGCGCRVVCRVCRVDTVDRSKSAYMRQKMRERRAAREQARNQQTGDQGQQPSKARMSLRSPNQNTSRSAR
ncbi:hypothetical protein AAG570_003236 [Ranatra chinensis]|uniref:Uncharacterized protein n=1 Tax=Ranatra chinensis TaxID=642074 RepID=A0ABD0Y678_9HEMI